MSNKNSILVAIKVRPMDKSKDQKCYWRIAENSIQPFESQVEPYYFDHIFDQEANNQLVFTTMAQNMVHQAIKGYNGTIFAYGQTSSGKTYTMMGDEENPGVIVLTAKEIFKAMASAPDRQFLLRVSYIEIYNEKAYDLLKKTGSHLKIQDSNGVVSINCEECIVTSEKQLLEYLIQGNNLRTVGNTNMNERSSRSHAIFRIIIESRAIGEEDDGVINQSVLNLVDLAGSERADQTGATGTRLKEGSHINLSLHHLSTVIQSLSENNNFINFRNSKLTRILQDSLGGNAFTAIICTIKLTVNEETQSTLSFAMSAKKIKNKPRINDIVPQSTVMKRLEQKINELQKSLEDERRKNEQLKVAELEKELLKVSTNFINSCSLKSLEKENQSRRRTWCGASTNNNGNVSSELNDNNNCGSKSKLPMKSSKYTSRLQTPKTYNQMQNGAQPVTLADTSLSSTNSYSPSGLTKISEDSIQSKIKAEHPSLLRTPQVHIQGFKSKCTLTPKETHEEKTKREKIEKEFTELRNFTNLEQKYHIEHTVYREQEERLKKLTERNIKLEEKYVQSIEIETKLKFFEEAFEKSKNRCNELKDEVDNLKEEKHKANLKLESNQKDLKELQDKIHKLELENQNAVSLDYELQSFREKSKTREKELLDLLNEKEQLIAKQNNYMQMHSTDVFQRKQFQKFFDKTSLEKNDEENYCNSECKELKTLLNENQLTIDTLKQLLQEHDQLIKDSEKLKEKLQMAQETITNLKEQNTNNKNEKKRTNVQAPIEANQKEIKLLKETINNLEEKYKVDIKCETEKKENLSKELENSNIKLKMLQTEYDQLQESLNVMNNDFKTIEKKCFHLQNEYEELKNNKHCTETNCQSLHDENEKLQEEIKYLSERLQRKQLEMLSMAESNLDTKSGIKNRLSSNQKLERIKEVDETNDLENRLKEAEEKYDILQSEYDVLSMEMIDKITLNDKYEKQCCDMQSVINKLENDNSDLKKKIEEITTKQKDSCKEKLDNSSSPLKGSGIDFDIDENDQISLLKKDEMQKFIDYLQNPYSIREIELFQDKTYADTIEKEQYPLIYRSDLHMKSEQNILDQKYKLVFGDFKSCIDFDINKTMDHEVIENSDNNELLKSNGASDIVLKGFLKRLDFQLIRIDGLTESKLVSSELKTSHEQITNLKNEIVTLKRVNEEEIRKYKEILENTESCLAEMREEINSLNAELLEKSAFMEKCCCETYKQQIGELEKEKYRQEIEAREKINEMAREHKNECDRLKLEHLDQTEITISGFRNNLKKYNENWEQEKEHYQTKISKLEEQLGKSRNMSTDLFDYQSEEMTDSQLFEDQSDTEKNKTLQATDLGATDLLLSKESLEEEINLLKSKNIDLENKCEELKTLQCDLEEMSNKYEKELNNLRKKENELKERDALINDLQDRLDKMIENKSKFDNQKLRSEQIIDDLNSKLLLCNNYQQRIEELEENIDEIKEKYNKLQKTNNEMEILREEHLQKIQFLENKKLELEKVKEELQRDCDLKTEKNEEMEKCQKERENELQSLQKEKGLLNEELNELKEIIKNNEVDLTCLRKEVKEKRELVEEKIASILELKEQNQENCTKLEKQNDIIDVLKNEEKNNLEQQQKLRNEIENAEKIIANFKGEYEILIEKEATLLATLNEHQECYKIEKERNEQEIQELKVSKEMLDIENKKLQEQIQEVHNEKEKLLQTNEKYEANMKELQEKLEELEIKMHEINKEPEKKLKSSMEDKDKEIENKIKLIEMKDMEIEENKKELKEIKEKLQDLSENEKQIEQKHQLELDEKNKQIEEIQCKQKDLEEKLHETNLMNERLQEKHLEERKTLINEKVQELTEQIKILEDKCKEAQENKNKVEELQNKLDKLKWNLEELETTNQQMQIEHKNAIDALINEKDQEINDKTEKLNNKCKELEINESKLAEVQEKLVGMEKKIQEMKLLQNQKEEQIKKEILNVMSENILKKIEELKKKDIALEALGKKLVNMIQNIEKLKIKKEKEEHQEKNEYLMMVSEETQRQQMESIRKEQDMEIKTKLKDMEEKNIELTGDLKKLQDEKSKVDQTYMQELKSLTEERNILQQKYEILQNEYIETSNKLEMMEKKCQESSIRFEEMIEKHKNIESNLQNKLCVIQKDLDQMNKNHQRMENLEKEHEALKKEIIRSNEKNDNLSKNIADLKSNLKYLEVQNNQLVRLEEELAAAKEENQDLQTKLKESAVKLNLESKNVSNKLNELKSCLEEQKYKITTLELNNAELKKTNDNYKEQLKIVKSKMEKDMASNNQIQKEAVDLNKKLETTIKESFSKYNKLNGEYIELQKQFDKQVNDYEKLKKELDNREMAFVIEREQLQKNLKEQETERQRLDNLIRDVVVNKFQQDLQRTTNPKDDKMSGVDEKIMEEHKEPRRIVTVLSPQRARRSLGSPRELMTRTSANTSDEERLQVSKSGAGNSSIDTQRRDQIERKQRRSSLINDRRQLWISTCEKNIMTDPVDVNCNCIKLDERLKELEKLLYIRECQVATLRLEFENHPLKLEVSKLTKRIQDEQEKARLESTRLKRKIEELMKSGNNLMIDKVVKVEHINPLNKLSSDAETQTSETGNDAAIMDVRTNCKYREMEKICRSRYQKIKELEALLNQKENVNGNVDDKNNQTEKLKKDLKCLTEKYECAKITLHSRRMEIKKLQEQVDSLSKDLLLNRKV